MSQSLSILLAEDDQNLGIILSEYLSNKGYSVDLHRDGAQALKAFDKKQYHFCIFDVMMPVMDGFNLAKHIRKQNGEVPILFLTAKSMREDRIEGFKIGADDYLTKPFSMEELLLRVEAIMKRVKGQVKVEFDKENHIYKVGHFDFDANKQKLNLNNEEQKLTSKESQLLEILVRSKNQVVGRSEALNEIWGDDSYYNSRSMDVYVTKLRKYIKSDSELEILNIHGKGFKLIEG